MKIKNKVAAAGLMLIFANVAVLKAQAAQTNRGIHGEFFTISVETIVDSPQFSNGHEFKVADEYLREALDKKAIETCSGRKFEIDDSRTNETDEPVPGKLRSTLVKLMTRVLCIDGE